MNAVLAIIALVILASAAVALSLRNLIHSALLLIGSWLGIAAFFLWAGAEFVAFAQVMVYVGAVSMIVLFAVLLTRRTRAEPFTGPVGGGRLLPALATGGAVAVIIASAVAGTPLGIARGAAPRIGVRRLGTLLLGSQAASLLAVGALLTVALLGAIVLAAADPGDGREGGP
jgi:NADH:ubiquinone oxidoreductase subunit 6 (subunit J)